MAGRTPDHWDTISSSFGLGELKYETREVVYETICPQHMLADTMSLLRHKMIKSEEGDFSIKYVQNLTKN